MEVEKTIKVSHLFVNYKTLQKEEGLKGSIKNFFNRKYMEIPAVQDLNLEVKQGEILGLIGPNGAGKSTTLKALSGIIRPEQGEIQVAGFQPYKRQRAFLRSIALLAGQRTQLWIDLPAMETFRLHQLIYEISEESFQKRLNQMVEMLNIGHRLKIPVRQLSLGERLKMELILSFLHEPKVLFLDEPTIGLDFISQNQIIAFLKEYNKKTGCSIILTSHYIKDIESLADRIQLINKGKTIITGNIDEIKAGYEQVKNIKVQLKRPLDKKIQWNNKEPEVEDPYTLVWKVHPREVKEVLNMAFSNLDVADVSMTENDLEDVLTQFY